VRKWDAVWITGVGIASPLGHDFTTVADHLLAGRSGVGRVTQFDTSRHNCQIAALLDPLTAPPGWEDAEFAALEGREQVIVWCVTQSLRDAGLWERRSDPRLGFVLGSGGEWLVTWEADMHAGGNMVCSPDHPHRTLLDRSRELLGLQGPGATVAAACASGNVALALAKRWVEEGWVDVCLAGACDRSVTPMGLAGFGNLRALSRRNHEPERASRPFDRARDGFIMGEGGAVFVLEGATAARRRGARVYAEIAGCGASSDASHLVIPSTDPAPAARAMQLALDQAGITPEQIDYVNAHATSTPVGDRFETRVLQTVLGEAVHTTPVSATKSMTGHLISAAAAIEAVACLAALDRQALPPTINLDDPDPECALCHVAHQAQSRRVEVTVSNSFGFGGSNTCLVLREAA
jgi:3-oxoacyl-[acyl-carrier-protein] synthase II